MSLSHRTGLRRWGKGAVNLHNVFSDTVKTQVWSTALWCTDLVSFYVAYIPEVLDVIRNEANIIIGNIQIQRPSNKNKLQWKRNTNDRESRNQNNLVWTKFLEVIYSNPAAHTISNYYTVCRPLWFLPSMEKHDGLAYFQHPKPWSRFYVSWDDLQRYSLHSMWMLTWVPQLNI